MLRKLNLLIAVILFVTGIFMLAFGSTWAPAALELLGGSELGAWLELIVPFLPMVFISLGVALYVSHRQGH